MDSFNYGKALSEMWTLGGKAFLEAQQQALRAMRDGAAAMGLPAGMTGGGLPGAAGLTGAPGVPGAMPPGAAGLPPPAFPNLAFDAGEIGKAGQALAELWTAASDLAAALARRLPQPAPQGADAAAGAAVPPAPPRPARTRRWPPPCGGWWTRGSGWAPATTWRKRCSAWRKGRASPTCGTTSAASPGCSGPGWRSAAAASSTRRWCWRAGQRRPGASPNASASAPRRRRRAARPRRPFFPRAPR